jgi:superfamily II DNA or RNA helicase
MIHFRLDIASHNFRVSGFSYEGYRALREYCRTELTLFGLVPVGYNKVKRAPILERRPQRMFAAANQDRKEFRFHINCLEPLIRFLIGSGFEERQIEKVYHAVPEGASCVFKFDPTWVPREKQVPAIEYLLSPGKSKLVILQTGGGKTSLTLKAISADGKRTAIVIKGMYVERWIDDIKQKLGLKPGELLVVRGSKDLTALIRMGLTGELKAKMIIITNRTLQIYFDTVEQFNGDYSLYGCHPADFYEVIGCGRRIIDEVHQDFHLNFKQDLYTNIERTIALTATFTADNHFINKMYDTAYPTLMRYTSEVYSQYIEVRCLIYGLQHPSPLRFLSRMKTYSHVEFEKSLMRHKDMTRRYTEMISNVVDTSYVRVRKPGQKMLIFCGTIKYCSHLQEHLQKRYPHLKVGRYVEEDKYEDLLNSDICVSTILSAGTAVDIPGLRITLMTNALSSSQANEQALGRLRELPGEVCEFLYFCCEDINKHLEYHEKKKQVFSGKVKAHHELYLGVRI